MKESKEIVFQNESTHPIGVDKEKRKRTISFLDSFLQLNEIESDDIQYWDVIHALEIYEEFEHKHLTEINQTLRDQVKELKEGVEGILKTEGSPTCHPSEVLPNWARSSLKSLLTKDTKNN